MHFCKRDKSNKKTKHTHVESKYSKFRGGRFGGQEDYYPHFSMQLKKKKKKKGNNFNRDRPRINKNIQIYPRIMNRYCLDSH